MRRHITTKKDNYGKLLVKKKIIRVRQINLKMKLN